MPFRFAPKSPLPGRAERILGDDQLSCQSLNKVVGEGRNAVDLAEEHLLAVEVVRLDVRVPRRRLRHEDPTAARVVSLVENESQPEPQGAPGTLLTNRTTCSRPYSRRQRPHPPQVEPLCVWLTSPFPAAKDDRPQKPFPAERMLLGLLGMRGEPYAQLVLRRCETRTDPDWQRLSHHVLRPPM
jgi:hypothetical protein